jgi:hypothetical protein
MSMGATLVTEADALPCMHVERGEPTAAVVAFVHSPLLRGLTGKRVVALRVCLQCLARYTDASNEILTARNRLRLS